MTEKVRVSHILYMIEKLKADKSLFPEMAMARSDCGSYKNGGDLGYFDRGEMQRPFEEAAFSLEVGELSGPVETESGVHVLLRTG
ncbi:peptidylprolyl isomerase, putative [Perkinsus marinus ATCC 50983]|uniref:Peptidyl-prolyl cis-trans isomerase n=1 Tax=Perkinsus marinus (strain ATCC 50983 / TXsc) TaxID=423536 RepID=C5L5A2_PERM5|nr:peptidylprolyl isomerase, putative [Perkinsus marinus ATCC 50983]EER08161.1 peptidylprolyl isomerase, putative [Perkinsus marinus ATCC 50983]|eukprot:XP_002776345.1 peptidylprolyl isomerase, putative [Perkinsus marinus ATCC 50983]